MVDRREMVLAADGAADNPRQAGNRRPRSLASRMVVWTHTSVMDAGKRRLRIPPRAQDQLEVGGVEQPLPGLSSHHLARQGRELGDDLPARLSAHEDAPARAGIADAGRSAASASACCREGRRGRACGPRGCGSPGSRARASTPLSAAIGRPGARSQARGRISPSRRCEPPEPQKSFCMSMTCALWSRDRAIRRRARDGGRRRGQAWSALTCGWARGLGASRQCSRGAPQSGPWRSVGPC